MKSSRGKSTDTPTKRRHIMSSESGPEVIHQQHERRFAQIDRDIFSVKTDVGVLQADVKTLAAGQLALQSSQDRGFSDIKETLQAKSEEQPKIGVGMLMSIFGVMVTIVAVGVGAFWSVVLLLADPIRNEVREHKSSTADYGRDIALLSERADKANSHFEALIKTADEHSAWRHDEQSSQLSDLRKETDALRESDLKSAELHGRQAAYEEMRRLNEQRVYEHLENFEKRPPTP